MKSCLFKSEKRRTMTPRAYSVNLSSFSEEVIYVGYGQIMSALNNSIIHKSERKKKCFAKIAGYRRSSFGDEILKAEA